MTARELTYELALGVIRLCLDRTPITEESIKGVRPALAKAYTKRYSTIPSYLGQGRNSDGLGLWRDGASGPRSASRDNCLLALGWLAKHGHDLDAIAHEFDFPDREALGVAVGSLPTHASLASVAQPAPSTAPASAPLSEGTKP
jgi:hypothetical protein